MQFACVFDDMFLMKTGMIILCAAAVYLSHVPPGVHLLAEACRDLPLRPAQQLQQQQQGRWDRTSTGSS
jgi:hypothetical protein